VCGIVEDIRRETLAAAVQRVESLPWTHENWIAWDERAAILAAIKAWQP
jgi:phage baseplate assembly protein gpV